MYSGLERIFEQIATNMDGFFPEGKNWHKDLLIQMSLNVKDIRSYVISKELHLILDEYRAFRHIISHVYSFQLDQSKISQLMLNLKLLSNMIQHDLQNFNQYLDKI